MENPDAIKYADLIVPDNSIEKLIGQLQQVIDEYDTLKAKTQASAAEMAKGLQGVSGATEEQRKSIQVTTEQTEKLVASYKQIETAETAVRMKQAELNMAFKEAAQAEKLIVQINTSAEGSYNKLSAQYRLNKMRLNEMSSAERSATDAGKQLEKETAAIMEEMKRLQDVTGKHQLHVGEYEIAAKGLRGQIMDLTQEMVRLRMEGKQGTAEYEEVAQKAGALRDAFSDAQKEVTNMASDTKNLDSVMGAASAARGGLGALTATMAIFGANSEGASKAQKILGSAIAVVSGLTAIQNALQKQSALMIALRTIKSKLFTKSIKEETAATVAHTAATTADAAATEVATTATINFKKALTLGGIGLAATLVGTIAANFKSIASSLGLVDDESEKYAERMKAALKDMEQAMEDATAMAEASGKTRSEILRQEIDNLQDLSDAYRETFFGGNGWWGDALRAAVEMDDELKRQLEENDKYFQELQKHLKQLEAAVVSYIHSVDKARRQEGMSEYEKQLDDINERAKEAFANVDKLVAAQKITAEQAAEYYRQIEEVRKWETEQATKDENERLAKEQKAAEEKARQEEERRKQRIEQERKAAQTIADNAADSFLTESQRLTKKYEEDKAKLEKFHIDTTNLTKKYQQDLAKIEEDETKKTQEEQKKRLSAEEKAIQLKLAAVESGSAEQEALQLKLWEKQRERELYENSLLDEKVKQNEADINAKWDAQILKQTTENAKKRAESLLKIQQAYDESEFNLLNKNEREKAIFKLNQQKASLIAALELDAKAGNKMTEQERKTIENTIKAIDNEVATKGYDNIYELLGINLKSDQQEALTTALDSVKDSITGVLDAWKEAADKAVESADKQVESAERILQAEIEARNAGYANNVETARKELALAQETQAKAKQERERAQKAQIAADAITQSSSLVTASANIWKSLSGVPLVGPGLAITAIATMWASFIASKAKAAELATDKYGEGTVELLQGGSHASGNDIDLGRTRTGRRRRAEGGEFFAIINKRNSRRFRSVIPDVINSFNDGTFAERYQRANRSLDGLALSYAGADVSGIERDVRAIRKQGEAMQTTEGGYIVERYKNLTKKYKI